MSKEKKESHAKYKPLVHKARFWFYSEDCYTNEELLLREWLLKTRSNSGLDPDYLVTSSSWFAEDSRALINVNEHSWFYSPAFRTHHVLNLEEFLVQPLEGAQLEWPSLYELMQKVGDYLLLRNKNLPHEHLNQPMNFIFLDINHILKKLCQKTNISHLKEQLELLTLYIRNLETNNSPHLGTDRIFLANLRRRIEEKILPQFIQKIESQLLRDRLLDLSKTLKELSSNRNRILHFALNINPVNPHPYEFTIETPDKLSDFPTQAAKDCAQAQDKINVNFENSPSVLHLTVEKLQKCSNFKLISQDQKILNHYSTAITDLNELERFQIIITNIIELLGKAGEVYTVHQFKDQMGHLLTQIGTFIDESSISVEAIIHANTEFYHKAIQDELNLPLLKRWFTSEKQILQTFIKNQDALAHFPSTSQQLSKSSFTIKTQVNQVLNHLNQTDPIEMDFRAIKDKTQELDQLIGTMHQWVKIQHELKGLPAPPAPELLTTVTEPKFFSEEIINYPPLFLKPLPVTASYLPHNDQQTTVQPSAFFEGIESTKLIISLPLGLIALYLLLTCRKNRARSHNDYQESKNSNTLSYGIATG